MNDTLERLREELKDPEYSEGYAESFLDSYLATQIKVLRERSGFSQGALAERIGTQQSALSRIENVNYSKWNVSTLKKLARAFRVRLKVSFETYGSLLNDVQTFSREGLQRTPRESDPILHAGTSPQSSQWHFDHYRPRPRKRARMHYATPYDLSNIPASEVLLLDTNHNRSSTTLLGDQPQVLQKSA